MSEDQVAVRRAKLAAWRARGVEPYRGQFTVEQAIEGLRERYGTVAADALEATPTVRVAGRLVGVRHHGRSAFGDLLDASGRIQLYARADRLGAAYDAFTALDLGDLVGAEGRLFRTRSGELSIALDGVTLLGKALRPLPEKWHGLRDVETRYRRRYVDLIVNEEVRSIFRTRSRVVRRIREFLEARGFLEVETPMMQAIPGGAAARPFVTHHQALDLELYLRVAPELYLKRLIVGGLERVYEINRSFRNEGVSTQHNPEFTMLEFYQAYAEAEDLMRLTEELIVGLAREVAGGTILTWGDRRIDVAPPWPRRPFFELLGEHLGVPVGPGMAVAGAGSALARAWGAAGCGGPVPDNWKDVFEALIEPSLERPTFVIDYPIELSPLARRRRDTPELAERFELFVGGREIANGYGELNDPDEQLERFRDQSARRARGDDEAHWLDQDYVRALEYGMPPTAGEGIGIDRLVMLLTGQTSIREVILFPLLRPEAGDRAGGDEPV